MDTALMPALFVTTQRNFFKKVKIMLDKVFR
jgi:hypothetical protein